MSTPPTSWTWSFPAIPVYVTDGDTVRLRVVISVVHSESWCSESMWLWGELGKSLNEAITTGNAEHSRAVQAEWLDHLGLPQQEHRS